MDVDEHLPARASVLTLINNWEQKLTHQEKFDIFSEIPCSLYEQINVYPFNFWLFQKQHEFPQIKQLNFISISFIMDFESEHTPFYPLFFYTISHLNPKQEIKFLSLIDEKDMYSCQSLFENPSEKNNVCLFLAELEQKKPQFLSCFLNAIFKETDINENYIKKTIKKFQLNQDLITVLQDKKIIHYIKKNFETLPPERLSEFFVQCPPSFLSNIDIKSQLAASLTFKNLDFFQKFYAEATKYGWEKSHVEQILPPIEDVSLQVLPFYIEHFLPLVKSHCIGTLSNFLEDIRYGDHFYIGKLFTTLSKTFNQKTLNSFVPSRINGELFDEKKMVNSFFQSKQKQAFLQTPGLPHAFIGTLQAFYTLHNPKIPFTISFPPIQLKKTFNHYSEYVPSSEQIAQYQSLYEKFTLHKQLHQITSLSKKKIQKI